MYINSSEAKKIGKENMKFQWGASLLAIVLYSVLLACGNIIPILGAVVIAGPLLYGLNLVYYRASFKEKINCWDLFKGFEDKFGETFLAGLLVNIFTFLWSLLFVIPGIIKAYSYSMYMYLMMREPELDSDAAIKKSMEYMSGHKWRLFCLELSFLGWTILEAITCGILAIYVEPWKMHAKMAFYNDLYEKKTAELAAKAEAQAAAQPEAPVSEEAAADIDPKFIAQPEENQAE